VDVFEEDRFDGLGKAFLAFANWIASKGDKIFFFFAGSSLTTDPDGTTWSAPLGLFRVAFLILCSSNFLWNISSLSKCSIKCASSSSLAPSRSPLACSSILSISAISGSSSMSTDFKSSLVSS